MIIPRLESENTDNCPLLANSDQQDICSSLSGNAFALSISGSASFGTLPLTVNFSQQYLGDLDALLRDFGDGTSYV